MSDDRTNALEHTVRILDNALWRLAQGRPCEYDHDHVGKRPTPCNCQICVAKSALAATRDWRFIGAHHARVTSGVDPREAKIHAAWKKLVDDRKLGQILYDGPYRGGEPAHEVSCPTARDWYVATSVVQWLATSVGMTVLEAAGFKYDQWDQDRADRDLMQRRQEREGHALDRKAPEPPSTPK
jgi:hypothetical protein